MFVHLSITADAWVQLGRVLGAAERGLRSFVEEFGARDVLFDVSVEGGGGGRVGTGRLTGL